jgi:hypothetical protein
VGGAATSQRDVRLASNSGDAWRAAVAALLILDTPQALLLHHPQSFHLMEHPIEGICANGPWLVSTTCFIASNRSRRVSRRLRLKLNEGGYHHEERSPSFFKLWT